MRIIHSDASSLMARHVPWVYWLAAAVLFVCAYRQLPPGLDGIEELATALILAGLGLLILLMWGPVVSLEIDRRRRQVVLKRWGLLGPRVRALPLQGISAIYMERHIHSGNGGKVPQHRLVLMDDAQQLVALTPFSFMELGLGSTSERLYDFLKESRGQPTAASYARQR
ncbi:MAG: hypothetical protein JXB05_12010 [Myxococcaceae bacterium]|nr:hypothetical protein [Myxococcaceae bacterium]